MESRWVILTLLWAWSAVAAPVFVAPGAVEGLRAQGAVVLDARSAERFAAGHVLGAVHAPWHAFTGGPKDGRLRSPGEVQQRLRALGVRGDLPVIVYGRWDQGWGEEGRLFWMLDYLGHPQVRVLRGGWPAWTGRVSQGAPKPAPGTFTARPVAARRWTTEQVGARLGALQVLDTRTAEEFAGATPYGSARGGHVPGARSLYWKGAFGAGGRLKDRAALRAWFEGAGVRFDQPVVAYCTGGVRSGFVYLLLRWLDHPSPGNDDGSWWAWAADERWPTAGAIRAR